MIRVAIPILDATRWTGGFNYLCNLLEALKEYAPGQIEPFLYAMRPGDLKSADQLSARSAGAPIVISQSDSRSQNWRAAFDTIVLQRHHSLERELRRARIDLVFQHSAWFGTRFGLPTLVWIPDFQHRYLPQLFTRPAYIKRELGYRALCHSATLIMLSSETVRQDCEKFYPDSRRKTAVTRFAVRAAPIAEDAELSELRQRYSLPERFFYLPNQFWKHKNHLLVTEAMARLRDQGCEFTVIASGSMNDGRDKSYPESVVQQVKTRGLEGMVRFLGFIPREDIPRLMQASIAVINPSLFEGWSTVVEEAKALAVPLILSDLTVHREQAPAGALYFDPADADALAAAMRQTWNGPLPSKLRKLKAAEAMAAYEGARKGFADCFALACQEALRRRKDSPM